MFVVPPRKDARSRIPVKPIDVLLEISCLVIPLPLSLTVIMYIVFNGDRCPGRMQGVKLA